MIETKSAFISKIDGDALKVILKTNAYLTVSEYDELLGHYIKLIGRNENIKFLVVVQPGFKMEGQYASFFKNRYKTEFKKAEAYVIKNPPSKMMFKVGIKLVPHKYPVKLFDTEAEALTWLKAIDKH